jgi:hypothetical protein
LSERQAVIAPEKLLGNPPTEPSPIERWALIKIGGEVSSGGEPKKMFFRHAARLPFRPSILFGIHLKRILNNSNTNAENFL